MIDVLIIEDHPFVAEATERLIAQEHPTVVTTVCNAAAPALRALQDATRSWHRVLLDLDVPGAHGLSLAQDIQELGFAPITCVVSATDRKDYIAQIRTRGFLGYIVKAVPASEYAASLAKILLGEHAFPGQKKARPTHPVIRLTRRQAQVLQLVSQGYGSKHIAARLGLSEGTINNHISAAMCVLGVNSRSHGIAKAIELGLLRVPREIKTSVQEGVDR